MAMLDIMHRNPHLLPWRLRDVAFVQDGFDFVGVVEIARAGFPSCEAEPAELAVADDAADMNKRSEASPYRPRNNSISL